MKDQIRARFNKSERLKSKQKIALLFEEGKSVSVFPLRLIYMPASFESNVPFKAAVSASKRNFAKAVERNKIKRLLREAYRLNKHLIFNKSSTSYALMILYIGNDMPDFQLINAKMEQLLTELSVRITNN